jgi:hypothetical protein
MPMLAGAGIEIYFHAVLIGLISNPQSSILPIKPFVCTLCEAQIVALQTLDGNGALRRKQGRTDTARQHEPWRQQGYACVQVSPSAGGLPDEIEFH